MKVRDFEEFVSYRAAMPLGDDSYNVIGLCGEAGEVAEWVKKAQFRKNKTFTEEMLKLELGDVLHYVTRIAINHGWGVKDLMAGNIAKLEARLKNKEKHALSGVD